VRFLNSTLIKSSLRSFVSNRELRFAVVHVTTRCNAKCLDRCNIWCQAPIDMEYDDALLTLDVLAKNHFSVAYLTGGETGLYPHLVEAVKYAKTKGLATSLTTNGTIAKEKLVAMRETLDVLSVSVDDCNEKRWDEAKHVEGISGKAKETIETARYLGMKVYAVTFLNPAWNPLDVEKVIHYVNDDLKIPFALSYPYISSNDGTYRVGGKLVESSDYLRKLKCLAQTVLAMKLSGSKIATSTCYLREVIRAHNSLPLKYPCKAGRTILTIDCKLNVFPCYKKEKLFNLKDYQDLNLQPVDSSDCDNKKCMINCFKEASEASKETGLKAGVEEFFSNPKFYLEMLK
jgi:MoaA/NifB/PqqE/SkfB family radical SAM enzyme